MNTNQPANNEINVTSRMSPSQNTDSKPQISKYNRDTLLNLGFEHFSSWESDGATEIKYQLPCQILPQFEKLCQEKNVLYAFIYEDNVMYIGKTTLGIERRLFGYCKPGKRQRTNIECKCNILQLPNKSVEILVFIGTNKFQCGDFSFNMAAGLEDSLIKKIKPTWNILGKNDEPITASEENEAIAETSQAAQSVLPEGIQIKANRDL